MDKNRITNFLELMIGNEYMIDGYNERVMDYTFRTNTVQVKTDRVSREFSEEQFFKFYENCLPVADDMEEMKSYNSTVLPSASSQLPSKQVSYHASFDSSTFSDLRNILMNNIENVQKDKGYLDQAEAVRDNVQSIIDLTKNEIDYVKTLTKLKG